MKVLCGVMNESVIHLHTTHDPIGSYAGVWLDIPDKSDPLHGVAPPFKTIKIHPHFTASDASGILTLGNSVERPPITWVVIAHPAPIFSFS